eukprot:4014801-Amphidinium_carterae.1
MQLQPDFPEAANLQQWWKQGGSTQNLTALSRAGGGGMAQNAKDMTLGEMKGESQRLADQMAHYNVASRLALVQLRKQGETQPLSYMSCQEPREGQSMPCQRRLDEKGFCVSCQRAGKAAPRLNLRCRFSDFADQAWLTTFNEPGEAVLGMSAKEVYDLENNGGRDKLEALIREKYFSQPFQLVVRAKLDFYQGESRTNITCVSAQPVNIKQHGRKMLKEIREHLLVAAEGSSATSAAPTWISYCGDYRAEAIMCHDATGLQNGLSTLPCGKGTKRTCQVWFGADVESTV